MKLMMTPQSRVLTPGTLLGTFLSAITVLTARADLTNCAPPPAGLVSWWRAEGGATDAAARNNGTLHGSAAFAAGKVGQAFSFDPASGTMIASDSISLRLTNQLTIEAWINTRSTNTDRAIVSKVGGAAGNNGYQLALSGNTIVGQFNSPGQGWPSSRIICAVPVAIGVWHHLAWTYDQSAMKLYFNGQPVATNVIGAKVITATSSTLRISGDDNDHVYFDGLIDEASVYNRALPAAEIAAIYNAGSAGKCGLAPTILTPPQSQTVECSSNATFSVTACGIPPLLYQWQFFSTNLPNATNVNLVLSNVKTNDAGDYMVVITNPSGSVTSVVATLTVLRPPVITR